MPTSLTVANTVFLFVITVFLSQVKEKIAEIYNQNTTQRQCYLQMSSFSTEVIL